jgi:ELWxxDGT repeat protein
VNSPGGGGIWTSDGTRQGTRLIKVIGAGELIGSATGFTSASGKLFFVGNESTHGAELWRSDGTSAGTKLVKDIYPGQGGAIAGGVTPFHGRVFLDAVDTHGEGLWRSDGARTGTRLVRRTCTECGPSGLLPLDDQLLFGFGDSAHGVELWTSDGSP